MKNVFFGLTMLVLGINHSIAQTADFRSFNWGDSLEKVKANEKAKFFSVYKGDELEYDDKLGDFNFKVLYVFNENNKLVSGIYIFLKKYRNPELYFQDYSTFLKLLSEKYGTATNEKETWATTDPTYDKANKRQAIADKDLNLYAFWNTDKTTIKITLISIGSEFPSMQIHYTTKSLSDFENPIDIKDVLNKL